jgi:hypothetical protein
MIISGHYHSAPLQITKELTTENKNFWKVQLLKKEVISYRSKHIHLSSFGLRRKRRLGIRFLLRNSLAND